MTFQHTRLPNHVTVLAEVQPEAHSAAVGAFMKVGTRDEPAALMGVSHFLEHMAFKGSARRSGDDVNRELDEIGASSNASTSHELTCYWAHVLPEQFGRATDLVVDLLRPTLADDEFAVEKRVILEEIGMYEDQPYWRLYDDALEQHFAGHPLGFRVLGTNETIEQMTAAQMRGYFAERYTGANTVIAAAGRIDFEKFVDEIARLTDGWQATGASRDATTPTVVGGEVTWRDARLSRQYIAVMCPAPAGQEVGPREAAHVASSILGDTDGSRLYWALVDPGVADDADLGYHPLDGVGYFMAYASCEPHRAQEVEAVLLETIGSLRGAVDAGEVERSRVKLATDWTVEGETPRGRMAAIGARWLCTTDYEPLDAEIDRLLAVERRDLEALADRYLAGPYTVVRLGP